MGFTFEKQKFVLSRDYPYEKSQVLKNIILKCVQKFGKSEFEYTCTQFKHKDRASMLKNAFCISIVRQLNAGGHKYFKCSVFRNSQNSLIKYCEELQNKLHKIIYYRPQVVMNIDISIIG